VRSPAIAGETRNSCGTRPRSAGGGSEALEAISEAEGLIERFEQRFWRSELYRLRGVFLANFGADEAQIEASFREAISTAKKQKSFSLEKRAEATYAAYRRHKTSEPEGREFRLPL
jgi:hypothetical protein